MANIREQERAELQKSIWNIANALRGAVDGWDFKQYVLGLLTMLLQSYATNGLSLQSDRHNLNF